MPTTPALRSDAACPADHLVGRLRRLWPRIGLQRLLIFSSCLTVLTLGSPAVLAAQEAEPAETAVRQVLDQVFSGMHEADSARVRAAHAEGARFALVGTEDDPGAIRYVTLDGWLGAIANSGGSWEERIYDVEIEVDDVIASAWVPYTFVLDGEVHHCGVNTSQFLLTGDGWKIVQTVFSQREEGCPAG